MTDKSNNDVTTVIFMYSSMFSQRMLVTAALLLLSIFVPLLKAVEAAPVKIWDRRFGGTSVDYFNGITAISDGGVVLAGSSYSNAGGDKTQSSRGGNDFWAVKVASDGSKLWDRRFGGTGNDACWAITTTSDGGVVLAGYSDSGADGDKTESSRGGFDFWAVKVASDGTKVWDRRFGGTGDDHCYAVTPTSEGGVVLAGWSNSGADGDKTESNRGSNDYWMVKVASDGSKVWDRRFGGTGDDACWAIAATSDGGVVVAGSSYSGADGDKTESSQGTKDFWAVKVDSAGTKVWDRRFGGTSDDSCLFITATSGGGVVLAGISASGAGGDKTEPSRGSNDYWAVKVASDGTRVWDRRFGGIGSDHCYAVTATSDDGIVLAGYSYSGAEGDKTELSRGSADYWAVKVASDGTKVWDRRFGGTNYDLCHAITATSDGGMVLAGHSASDANGDKTESSRGSIDYWAVKIAAIHTVTFAANGGGTPSPVTKSVTNTSTYGALATVSRPGYKFMGWFTAASGGTEVTSSTVVALVADQTLYAQWGQQLATTTISSGGGCGLGSGFGTFASLLLGLMYILKLKRGQLQRQFKTKKHR